MSRLRTVPLAPLAIAGGAIALSCLPLVLPGPVAGFHFVQRLEWLTYDWRMRRAAAAERSRAPAARYGLVFLDDTSVARLGEGALLGRSYGLFWPRQIYGRLVRELSAQGAKLVGFDVLFGELRPDHPPVDSPGRPPQGSDEFFAEQLRRAGNVVLAAETNVVPPALFRTNALAVGDVANETESDGVLRRVAAFKTYRLWNPLFQRLAWQHDRKLNLEPGWVRFLNPTNDRVELAVPIDAEGRVRLDELTGQKAEGFVRLLPAYSEFRLWHMGIVLAARHLGLDLDRATVEPGRIVLRGPGGVQRIIPVDAQQRFWVRWTLPAADPRLLQRNIENLLLQDLGRAAGQTSALTAPFAGALVVVGSAATGSNLADLGATPLAGKTLLVSTHWNVAEMILTGRFLRRAGRGVELALIVGLGLVSALLSWRVRSGWASLAVGALLAGYGAAAVLCFIYAQYWLPVVLPAGGGLGLTHLGLVTYRAVFEQREQRRIKRVFGQIVSPNVVHELLRAERLALGGARRPVTVLFADVRGFTELSDQNQTRAEQLVARLGLRGAEAEACLDDQARDLLETVNAYLSLVAQTVKDHEGTLDKYIGDCVMAFWGAPTPNEQHALAAVRAAIAIQRAVETFNRQRAEENRRREEENPRRAARGEPPLPPLPLLHLGCGLNTGVATVGLMGSDAHLLNYTVFGREVNVASRLEGLSGQGRILIGEATHRELQRLDPALAAACRELPPVTVKGLAAPVKSFEVPWQPTEAEAAGQVASRA